MGNAAVYADALFELALEEGLAEHILSEIMLVRGILTENSGYIRLLSAHSLTAEERLSAAREAFGNTHKYLKNTLLIMVEKGYAGEICSCADRYRERYNDANGIVDVVAYCAHDMTEEQKQKLRVQLEKRLERSVFLIVKRNEQLVGGVRLELPGISIDGTLSGKLGAIRAQLIKN